MLGYQESLRPSGTMKEKVVASICVVGPTNRINNKNLGPISRAVINCAEMVSRKLEHSDGSRD